MLKQGANAHLCICSHRKYRPITTDADESSDGDEEDVTKVATSTSIFVAKLASKSLKPMLGDSDDDGEGDDDNDPDIASSANSMDTKKGKHGGGKPSQKPKISRPPHMVSL